MSFLEILSEIHRIAAEVGRMDNVREAPLPSERVVLMFMRWVIDGMENYRHLNRFILIWIERPSEDLLLDAQVNNIFELKESRSPERTHEHEPMNKKGK